MQQFKKKIYNRRQKKTILISKTCNNLTIKNYQKNISKLSLYNVRKASNSIYNKCICYNCNKKKYISRKYLKISKKSLQINIIKNF